LAVGPCQDVSGWLQISWLLEEPEDDCADCGVNVGSPVGSATPVDGVETVEDVEGVPCVSSVGKGGCVSVGRGATVSVGGTGVAVGKAC